MAYDWHTVWSGAIWDRYKGWPNSQDIDIIVFKLPAFQKQHIGYDKFSDMSCSISWIFYLWRGQILHFREMKEFRSSWSFVLLCSSSVMREDFFYTKINDCVADCLTKYRFLQGRVLWCTCWLFIYRHTLIPSNEKLFYRRVYKGTSEFLYLTDTFRSVEVYSTLLPFPSVRFVLVKWLIT
jgi:hypothetical protein